MLDVKVQGDIIRHSEFNPARVAHEKLHTVRVYQTDVSRFLPIVIAEGVKAIADFALTVWNDFLLSGFYFMTITDGALSIRFKLASTYQFFGRTHRSPCEISGSTITPHPRSVPT
ncbi:hypothetical protein [Burkholderia ubonensis]|uniref:hypothetical protein n=1 Tax=Burkholderia ubonensis TaxID=101571 RepID=UPI000AD8E160|nr:hypothetical protein [Burkholderia ubonensis]